ASLFYKKALQFANPTLASKCWNQLGCLSYQTQDYPQALIFFQKAILAQPSNQLACRNYELLKKLMQAHPEWIKEQEEMPEKREGKPGESNPEENNASSTEELNPTDAPEEEERPENDSDPEGEEDNVEGERENLNPEKLEEIKLNRDKAETILEALRNREIQYIQQLKRRKKKRKKSLSNPSRW
ncbi:MAG: hypothetical protein AAFU64_21115, partial [Bacteroidota bacterium]